MRKSNIKLIKEFFRARKEVGEDGFWVDPNFLSKEQKKKPCSEMADGIETLKPLEEVVKKCNRCPLGKYRLNACFGNGNPTSKIMFIGEGPGYEEDHRGEVFVGRAGQLLDRIIETTLELKRSDVYITNIVKCHPMKDQENPDKRGNDRPPTEEESTICIELYLKKQIDIIRPDLIVTLGSPATKTILNTEKGITGLRGNVFDRKIGQVNLKIVPTYHPAYLLRNPAKKEEVFEDIKLMRSLL